MYGKKSCDAVGQKGTGNHVYQWEHFGYRYFLENVSNPLRHSKVIPQGQEESAKTT
jgi:hypothetical protein